MLQFHCFLPILGISQQKYRFSPICDAPLVWNDRQTSVLSTRSPSWQCVTLATTSHGPRATDHEPRATENGPREVLFTLPQESGISSSNSPNFSTAWATFTKTRRPPNCPKRLLNPELCDRPNRPTGVINQIDKYTLMVISVYYRFLIILWKI